MINLPKYELANTRYETPRYKADRHILLVSTPRSGSTMLCTDIDYKDGGAAAEYCQPYQIIPYLMKKRTWIVENNELNYSKYAEYLINYRSGRKKSLFINIHSHHYKIYKNLNMYLPKLDKIYILFRENIIAQAVSYYIAKETSNWSSNYKNKKISLDFNYEQIKYQLEQLIDGSFNNVMNFKNYSCNHVLFENYLEKKLSFAKLNNVNQTKNQKYQTKSQQTNQNNEFIFKFNQLLEKEKDSSFLRKIDNYKELINSL